MEIQIIPENGSDAVLEVTNFIKRGFFKLLFFTPKSPKGDFLKPARTHPSWGAGGN
jgi:hypothetical protein